MKPIGGSRRRTSRPSTDHHMVGACDLNGSQSRYSMEHIHHESNYFILLQHKSIYLDGEPHVVLTLLCRAQLHVEQIMLLHSLVAHSRRQSIMFHAGESHDGTALKSTVHCRPMERCRHLVGRHALALVRTSPSAFHLSQLQTASFSAWGKELLWLQKELEAETLIKGRARALRIP